LQRICSKTYLSELDLLAAEGGKGQVSDLELSSWSSRHICGVYDIRGYKRRVYIKKSGLENEGESEVVYMLRRRGTIIERAFNFSATEAIPPLDLGSFWLLCSPLSHLIGQQSFCACGGEPQSLRGKICRHGVTKVYEQSFHLYLYLLDQYIVIK
jgi:hypothetical protein